MAKTTNAIELSSSKAAEPQPQPYRFFNSKSQINQTPGLPYDCAKVESVGGQTESFYILYSNTNYNQDSDGIIKVIPEQFNSGCYEQMQYTEFEEKGILSVQGFDIDNPGLILFPRNNLQGVGIQHKVSSSSLNYPNGFSCGSVICTGGKWTLYYQENYEGQGRELNGCEVINNLTDGQPLEIKSIQFVSSGA